MIAICCILLPKGWCNRLETAPLELKVTSSNLPSSRLGGQNLYRKISYFAKWSFILFAQHIICKIDKDLIHLESSLCMDGDNLSTEAMKVELACLYYLQLPSEKRSEGRHSIEYYMLVFASY